MLMAITTKIAAGSRCATSLRLLTLKQTLVSIVVSSGWCYCTAVVAIVVVVSGSSRSRSSSISRSSRSSSKSSSGGIRSRAHVVNV